GEELREEMRLHGGQQPMRADHGAVVILKDQVDGIRGVELVLLDTVRLAQGFPAHPLHEDPVAQAEHALQGILVVNRVFTGDDVDHAFTPGYPYSPFSICRTKGGQPASPQSRGMNLPKCLSGAET